MDCPNCQTPMDHHVLGGKLGADIEIDVCFACHVLWLDKRESLQLSPRGTMDLFRALHEHRDDPRHALGEREHCPRCGTQLKLMHDFGKSGRFSYYSCPSGHGRLTPFSEFLKEKQFVRSLTLPEKNELKAAVKQVQCSRCGAPVELAKGFECGHCGSALTVLDHRAVEKTLRELDEADRARQVDVDDAEARARAIAALESTRTDPNMKYGPDSRGRGVWNTLGRPATGGDLISASIEGIFTLLGR